MSQQTRSTISWLSLLIIIVIVGVIFSVSSLLNVSSTSGINTRSVEFSRQPRIMPVVEDYYSKGWDFRARNSEEQILVVTTKFEEFESKLFKISAAVSLCAHLGYAPPTILVDRERVTDSEIPESCNDIPELLQDIFPKLKIISVHEPDRFVNENFPDAMILNGAMKRNSTDPSDFKDFPPLNSSTIVIKGSWESWEYVDDYRLSVFEHLEFHPVIYHHSRKTYPMLFDRRTPVRGIFIGDVSNMDVESIKKFCDRSPIDNERIVMYCDQAPSEETLRNMFGDNYSSRILIITGECHQVQIYIGMFCRELLIDLSNLGWWVGFQAIHRGKTVYYVDNENASNTIPLMNHYLHPSFLSNKN